MSQNVAPTKTQAAPEYRVGEWVFYPALKKLVGPEGAEQGLEDKVSDLLLLLCERRGDILSREDILEKVWQGRTLSEQTVPVAISKIRKALGDGGADNQILKTIPKRGYMLVEAEPVAHRRVDLEAKRWTSKLGLAAALFGVLIIVGFFWPTATPFIPPAGAVKPGIILTVKDIRTSLESQKETGKVIALSELTSYYLSQIPEVLVIRHWWNVDEPDPTGGIFTRYGEDTPVYLLTGTLIEENDELLVTLFLSNPRTDEVIWSGIHAVDSGSSNLFNTLAEMFLKVGVLGTPQSRGALARTPSDDDRFWAARFFAHLSKEGPAQNAVGLLRKLLVDDPANSGALQMVQALTARWQAIEEPTGYEMADVKSSQADYLAFVDQAVIELYKNKNTKAAEKWIGKALKLAPGDHYALSLKAEIMIVQGRFDEALKAYQKAARLAPFAKAYAERLAQLQLN